MADTNNPNIAVAASRGTAAQTTLHFPANLDSLTNDRLTIRFHEYSRGNPLLAPKSQQVYSITLPIPNSGLEDNTSIDYDETALGAAIGGALGTFGTAGKGTTWAQKAAALGEGVLQAGLQSASGRLGDLADSVLGSVGTADKAKAGISQSLGSALNPNLSLTFNGVHLREHNFNWRLIAKSEEESRDLAKIINILHQASLPRKIEGAAFALAYPYIAYLDFTPLNLIKVSNLGCFLSDISIKYDGDGHPAFYKVTNAPVIIDLSLKFHERAIQTAEDYGSTSISVEQGALDFMKGF